MKSVINAIPLERLLEQLPENYTLADRELVHRAYRVAEEDTTITLNDIRRDFGETIAILVDGVTKLTNLPRVSRGDQHAESQNGSEPSEASSDNGKNNG